jgi:serine/threonine protein kinase
MILSTLTGPSVPRFVAAGDLTATPYIVMERIDGQGLEQIIARAPLPPDEVARIGAALADAVHSVHTQQVIHLDLKPENVILRPTGDAVLLDFGFARHAHYPDLLAESKDFAAGSAAHVSPSSRSTTAATRAAISSALGVLLYELATGRQPSASPRPTPACAIDLARARSTACA